MQPQLRTSGRAGAAVAALLVLASCSSPADPLPRPDHVMVVVFENEDADDIVGSPDAPYLTSLARSGATLTDSHGLAHPSQANYIALFSGSTGGVEGDDCPVDLTGDNLASQLAAAGFSFTGWSEGLPSPGYTGCESGDYVRKHNPWADFRDLPPEVNQPLSAMPTDYSQLPTVSFVIPDMCDDMHDCDVDVGDAWAEEHLAPYAEWARDHDSLLIVTFDEDSGTEENRIATIVAGAGVAPGTTVDEEVDHYDLLRTLEDLYGLRPLGEAADATAITGIWSAAGG